MTDSVVAGAHHLKRSIDLLIPGFMIGCIGLILWVFSFQIWVEMQQSIQLFVAETNVVAAAELTRMLLNHLVRWVSEFLTINLPTLAQM